MSRTFTHVTWVMVALSSLKTRITANELLSLPSCRHHLLLLDLLSFPLSKPRSLTSAGLSSPRLAVMCSTSPKAATETFQSEGSNCYSQENKTKQKISKATNMRKLKHGLDLLVLVVRIPKLVASSPLEFFFLPLFLMQLIKLSLSLFSYRIFEPLLRDSNSGLRKKAERSTLRDKSHFWQPLDWTSLILIGLCSK